MGMWGILIDNISDIYFKLIYDGKEKLEKMFPIVREDVEKLVDVSGELGDKVKVGKEGLEAESLIESVGIMERLKVDIKTEKLVRDDMDKLVDFSGESGDVVRVVEEGLEAEWRYKSISKKELEGKEDVCDYILYLRKHSKEVDELVEALVTMNVNKFNELYRSKSLVGVSECDKVRRSNVILFSSYDVEVMEMDGVKNIKGKIMKDVRDEKVDGDAMRKSDLDEVVKVMLAQEGREVVIRSSIFEGVSVVDILGRGVLKQLRDKKCEEVVA